MKKKLVFSMVYIFIFMSIFGVCLSDSFSAERVTRKEKDKKMENMTNAELVQNLEEILDKNPEVMERIPGLRKKQRRNKVYYEYRRKRLEKLDHETLVDFLTTARQAVSKQSLTDLQSHLKTLRTMKDVKKSDKMVQ